MSTSSKRKWTLLGRLVMEKEPELADEYLRPYSVIMERDLKQIPDLFKRYCEIEGIDKYDYYNGMPTRKKMEIRRIFTAAMIHIYYPGIYQQSIINIGNFGFGYALSDVLSQHGSNVSKTIKKVVFWEKNYQDFKEKVLSVTEKLK